MDARLKRFYERKNGHTLTNNKEIKKMINPEQSPYIEKNKTSTEIIETMADIDDQDIDMYTKIITEKPTINKLRTMIKQYIDDQDD